MTSRIRKLLCVLVLAAPPLRAQTPMGPVQVRAGLSAPSASSELRTASGAHNDLRLRFAADSVPETQWLKGGVIGGLFLGLATAFLVHGAQQIDDFEDTSGPVIRGFLIGGALGFGIGSLIGGTFEK